MIPKVKEISFFLVNQEGICFLHPKRTMTKKKRALLSVYNKEGLVDLGKSLASLGYELVSSGGTAKILENSGVVVTAVESITGNTEAFEGRMKTLSFQIESSILFDRDNPTHQREAEALGLIPIDVVVCNFYPFHKALEENLPLQDAIELIDIGGPAMVRAAAKNHKHVLVIIDPSDYPKIIGLLQSMGEVPVETRLALAAKAFQHTADYDAAIDTYFQKQCRQETLKLSYVGGKPLRYGENPHQKGKVFWQPHPDALSLSGFKQLAGKELSFNNFLDSDSAVGTLARLGKSQPACVIVKHTNACGAAFGKTIEDAFEKAWESDPIASFGGIVAMNRPITLPLVNKFLYEKKFVEIFLAPAIADEALHLLAENKKNLIVLINPYLSSPFPHHEPDFKKIRGGVLWQTPDSIELTKEDFEVVSKRSPSPQEWDDLLFAWDIIRELKSNSIVLVKNNQLIGTAAGQQDRVRACKLAVEKGGNKCDGSAAASDGFFPFPDGPELLIAAGTTAIVHPGGSMRDSETIHVCDKHNVALVTTKGIRAFKH